MQAAVAGEASVHIRRPPVLGEMREPRENHAQPQIPQPTARPKEVAVTPSRSQHSRSGCQVPQQHLQNLRSNACHPQSNQR